jgi:restriction system protein
MTAAWLVRAGREGEREHDALTLGLVIAGWPEIGDLSQYETRADLYSAVREAYPNRSRAVVANWTGQLWRLQRIMHTGDLVVMPRRNGEDQVAIGRVTGGYSYRADAAPDRRHVRPVDWIRVDQPRSAIRQDLLYSLGSLLTICELRRNEAMSRLEQLAADGVDPGPSNGADETELVTPAELISRAVASEDGISTTVRELLGSWNVRRRTANAVAMIESELAEHALTTIPPITDGWMGSRIRLVRTGADADDTTDETPMEKVIEAEQAAAQDQPLDDEPATGDESTAEKPFTLRFGHLLGEDSTVASVSPKDDLVKAQTMMLRLNYSQLAVIDEHGTLHGAVSWESIARTAMRSTTAVTVSDARGGAVEVGFDERVLPRLGDIAERGFVFVRGRDRKATVGIVTSADLTQRFGDIVRPFTMIEDCERRLKRRVCAVFSDAEIRTATNGRYKTAEKLTLGAYPHLLEEPANFARLAWPLDHKQFCAQVKKVAEIRNKMMHFSPDPLPTDEWSDIDGLLAMLHAVDPAP